jgi:hypothetical protein|tara:strand:- start:325 stop:549 length:225 start_codon:yes stop_codon:yes gene_type:complete
LDHWRGFGCAGFTLDFICINGVDVMTDDLKDREIPNEALDILRPYCDSDDEAKDAFKKLFALWNDYQQEKYETE